MPCSRCTYKADIEAALRTRNFGGFQLLGLNDFPGQGTALVGVLDAFWEEKGYISSHIEREGKMPEKSVYSLTEKGKRQFEKLMLEISCKPINIFLDFNAVIVNLDSMPRERQQECLDNIESSMEVLKKYLEENIALKKSKEDIPVTGMAVLQQQYTLAEAIEEWIASLKKEINS